MHLKKRPSFLQYGYPTFLDHWPRFIWFFYGINYLTQLRKWYVVKAWKQLLVQQQPGFIAIDIGAGEGQYLVPFANSYPASTFVAADLNPANVALYQNLSLPNLKALLLDIAADTPPDLAQLILCVGVLHYIEKDEAALKNIYKCLQSNGRFLLYSPIGGHFLTKFYPSIFQRYPQYESLNNRQRIYQEDELLQKLERVGFRIISKTYAYGWAGKLSHEIFNSGTTLLFSAAWPLKILALMALVLFYPLVLLLMAVDFLLPKKRGNGILILCEK
jgi:SAM-dependent methyltransferase